MAEGVTNHFVQPATAARYDRHRPRFHPRVIEMIRARLGLTAPLPCALDVACGTGHSAVALRAIADRVLATDLSEAMLALAPPVAGITYRRAPAEALPVGDGEFPLLTVCMAAHWFDRPRFLAEAARVLAPGGWLVLYGYNFCKTLTGAPEFTTWYDQVFLARYPQPPRHDVPLGEADLAPHGLTLVDSGEFAETRPYTAADFTQYVLTHSGAVSRVDSGAETPAAAAAWIEAELARFYGAVATRDFDFAGWITWIHKR